MAHSESLGPAACSVPGGRKSRMDTEDATARCVARRATCYPAPSRSAPPSRIRSVMFLRRSREVSTN